jgi:DNA-binding NarL/FixJ family response regulator
MHMLIVEDDEMHLVYLKKQLLKTFGDSMRIDVARNGHEAELLARSGQIMTIVMDLRMKDRNGIEAARVIWRERPDTRILFWSNYSNEAYLRGIARIVPDKAVYGYVLKTASAGRLALALKVVLLEGQIMIDREVSSLQNAQNRSPDALTEMEYVILLDVAIGLPDKIISERRSMSLRTVQNRLIALYEKLEGREDYGDERDIQLNKRVRAITNALAKQVINPELLKQADEEFKSWLAKNRGDRA